MIVRLLHTAAQIVEGLGGVVGIRAGTEEPHYVAEALSDRVEIRQYGPRVAAETTVSGTDQNALSTGFRRLAGYIFGGNHRGDRIDMTAPVTQSREQIAMTAPVVQDGSVVRFFMPSKWSLATLPQPDDDTVRLVEVPAETVAVLRFSGDRSHEAVAVHTEELLTILHDSGVETTGAPVTWFYDPPWTIPPRRRTEVAVPVAG